jgi:hypothetical protein
VRWTKALRSGRKVHNVPAQGELPTTEQNARQSIRDGKRWGTKAQNVRQASTHAPI